MAFGNNSFSEAAFASAGPTSVNLVGFGLTTNLNSVATQGELGVDVPVTGFDLTVNNTTQIQDTLTAFAQAPFATESPSTFDPPNIDIIIVSNAAVTGIAMTANEIAGGEPRRAIAMLDQAKELLMQQLGSEDGGGGGAGEPDMGRLAEILGGGMMG